MRSHLLGDLGHLFALGLWGPPFSSSTHSPHPRAGRSLETSKPALSWPQGRQRALWGCRSGHSPSFLLSCVSSRDHACRLFPPGTRAAEGQLRCRNRETSAHRGNTLRLARPHAPPCCPGVGRGECGRRGNPLPPRASLASGLAHRGACSFEGVYSHPYS